MLMDEFLAREKMNRHTKRGRGGHIWSEKNKTQPDHDNVFGTACMGHGEIVPSTAEE